MRRSQSAVQVLSLVSALAGASGAALAADAQHPIVIELFQSQGCNSCPPANANINALSDRSDILTLSFAITYWDNLGWKDTFAKQQYTDRQYAYSHALGADGVYTPQVIVNGRKAGVGTSLSEIESLEASGARPPGPSMSLNAGGVAIGAGAAPASGADVWLVRYDPRQLDVAIARGENAGKTLPHRNIVKELTRLGHWSGQAERLDIPAGGDQALRVAVLVQNAGEGAILAAVKQ